MSLEPLPIINEVVSFLLLSQVSCESCKLLSYAF